MKVIKTETLIESIGGKEFAAFLYYKYSLKNENIKKT